MGAKGAVLSVAGSLYNIPACSGNAVVDPTGAGDVFIGAFLTEYTRAKETFWCACVGSAAASLVVESLGATSIGQKDGDLPPSANPSTKKELSNNQHCTSKRCHVMGRIDKGVKCDVSGCSKEAVRSINTDKAKHAGLESWQYTKNASTCATSTIRSSRRKPRKTKPSRSGVTASKREVNQRCEYSKCIPTSSFITPVEKEIQMAEEAEKKENRIEEVVVLFTAIEEGDTPQLCAESHRRRSALFWANRKSTESSSTRSPT